jgi:Dihydrofolate reductase
MMISLIVAMAENRVIGMHNQMPWHMPADLRHFKAVTMGKPVVMGRRTFESIGRPLPGRRNVVITRNASWQADGVERASSLDDALALLSDYAEVMIIGGGQLYAEALPRAHRLYLTHIDLEVAGDTWFPDYSGYEWQTIGLEAHEPDEKNRYAYRFETLERQITA